MAARQGENLERKDQAHGRIVEERPGAGGVRKHDVRLQAAKLVVRDARLRKTPEAGVDPVRRFSGGDDPLDRFETGAQRRQARRVELERGAFPRDPAQGGEIEGPGADLHRCMGSSKPFSAAQAIASA
jgi:hypothetical protein